jgi:hypothetical protein
LRESDGSRLLVQPQAYLAVNTVSGFRFPVFGFRFSVKENKNINKLNIWFGVSERGSRYNFPGGFQLARKIPE